MLKPRGHPYFSAAFAVCKGLYTGLLVQGPFLNLLNQHRRVRAARRALRCAPNGTTRTASTQPNTSSQQCRLSAVPAGSVVRSPGRFGARRTDRPDRSRRRARRPTGTPTRRRSGVKVAGCVAALPAGPPFVAHRNTGLRNR